MPEARSTRLWREVKATGPSIIGYWLILVIAWGAFSALITARAGGGGGVFAAIIGGTTAAATLSGQLCALLRLRSIWAIVVGTLITGALFALAMALTVSAGAIGALSQIVWFFFPFFAITGYWSLREGKAFLALWSPLVYLTSIIITIATYTGSSAAWFQGSKYAFWNAMTLPILGGAIVLCLLWLAMRERSALARWRQDEQSVTRQSSRVLKGSLFATALGGIGTLGLLLVFALTLTVGTAVVSPYLFRTGPADQGEERPSDANRRQGEPKPQPSKPQPSKPQPSKAEPKDGDPQPGDPIDGEQVQRAVKQAGIAAISLLLMVFLALLGLFVFGPPVRRAIMLRHLRQPLLPMSPSEAVIQAWHLAEVALGDAGVAKLPGEAACDYVGRAHGALPPSFDIDTLSRAAEVADRVRFGFALSPEDRAIAHRAADMAYEAVWEQLSEWERLVANYRWL